MLVYSRGDYLGTVFQIFRTMGYIMIKVILDVMLCGLIHEYQHSLRTCHHHHRGKRVSSALKPDAEYSSTLKMKTAGSTKTFVPIYQTAWHHIPLYSQRTQINYLAIIHKLQDRVATDCKATVHAPVKVL